MLRNYPLVGRLRFLLEEMRPEMRQYFFEDEKNGAPFDRDERAVVYQRAKGQLDKRPFGTQLEVYNDGFEWLQHSIAARQPSNILPRVIIGGPDCARPYEASLLNISAMSFGSLSANAIKALNRGARMGGFAHDTGEGGLSLYHLDGGGDLIWEIGSGYFTARNPDGSFSPERFAEASSIDQVKMVELKISQGAKPGQGGILPAAKVSPEIAATRGVEIGVDCISPPRHSAFSTPIEMMNFIARMRTLAKGKPAGFKLCIGHPWEFLAICKAMLETGIYARLHRHRRQGRRHRRGAARIHGSCRHAAARGPQLRTQCAGRCWPARADQARRERQDHHVFRHGARLRAGGRLVQFGARVHVVAGLHPVAVLPHRPVSDRRRNAGPHAPAGACGARQGARVHNFHAQTLHALAELCAAAGLDHPRNSSPSISPVASRRARSLTFADLYPGLSRGRTGSGHQPARAGASPWEHVAPGQMFFAADVAHRGVRP